MEILVFEYNAKEEEQEINEWGTSLMDPQFIFLPLDCCTICATMLHSQLS